MDYKIKLNILQPDRSPPNENGTRYRVTVTDLGVLTVAAV